MLPPGLGTAGDRVGDALGGCSTLGSCVHPPERFPLSVVPRAKPSVVLGQKWCKAISPLLWVSSTSVTPEGHPEQELGCPTGCLHCRDCVCSWGAASHFGVSPWLAPGVTSVICVTDAVTLGPCLCVTAGFLRSSAASVADGFRILPSVTEPEPHPHPCAPLILTPRPDAVPSVPNVPHVPPWHPGAIRLPVPRGMCSSNPKGFGSPFILVG